MTSPLLFALLVWSGLGAPPPGERSLPFSDGGWKLNGDRTVVEREGDREVLRIESGTAHRRDVQLEDGTIDLDLRVTRRRSFVYLQFRMQDDGEHEEVYFRPHKSGLPDAVQYAPVWQGRSAWQLHHGPGGTASVEFEPGAWTHVRLVLQGRHAAVFVGDMAAPVLVVPTLAREPRAGFLALQAFAPAGTPGEGAVASYANVVVRPGVVPFAFSSLPQTPRSTPGVVRAWAVSGAFVPKDTTPVEVPGTLESGAFQRLDTEPDGLLELHRFVRIPRDAKLTAVVARVIVSAAKAGLYPLDLGFSDVATVFLNGRPLFRGEGSYSFDAPRREGLIGYDQARIYLPLAAGDNDLSILVSDSFGGWGLMGRLPASDGLRVEAR